MTPPKLHISVHESNPGRRLDNEQPRRQASKRPGQAPPINHPGQRSRRHAEAGPNTSSSSGWWSERQQRRHDAWDDRREADEQMMLATTPQQGWPQLLGTSVLTDAIHTAVPSTPVQQPYTLFDRMHLQ